MNNKKLFVGNLTYSVRAGQLRDLFSKYGTVIDVTVLEQKGYGFVEMKSPEEAAAAKAALSEKEFEGRHLLIDGLRPPMKPKGKPGAHIAGSSGRSPPGRSKGRPGSSQSHQSRPGRPKPGNRSDSGSSGKKRTSGSPGRTGSFSKGKSGSGDRKPKPSSSSSSGSGRRYWGGMKG